MIVRRSSRYGSRSMLVRCLALLLMVQAALAAGAGASVMPAARPRIVGGSAAAITDAPWAVRVSTIEGGVCSGVIVSSTAVVTAAHCVADAAAVRVRAGISEWDGSGADDAPTVQVRDVSTVAIHPYYDATSQVDDVAILTVSPFDFSGGSVQPIVVADVMPATGAAGRLFGWGQTTPGYGSAGEYLQSLDESVSSPAECDGNPVTDLCASSPIGAACRGDSGGGLTLSGSAPEVIGLDSLGSSDCGAGAEDVYVNLTMPEVHDFIEGDSAPPIAPRGGLDVAITSSGYTATCSPGTWSGSPTFVYTFSDEETGIELQTGPSPKLVVPQSEAGQVVTCSVTATNAGGSVESTAGSGVDVEVTPTLSINFGQRNYVLVYPRNSWAELTITDHHGRVVRWMSPPTYPDADWAPPIPALRRGVYTACIHTHGGGYVDAKQCATELIKSSRSLIRLRYAHVNSRRWSVEFDIGKPAIGQKATIIWRTASGASTRPVVLRGRTVLAFPRPPEGSTVRLVLSFPMFRSENANYLGVRDSYALNSSDARRVRVKYL